MFKMFELTPEKMQARMLAEAQRRLVEAEHAENHWRHEANKARAEIERLTGRKVVETTSKVAASVAQANTGRVSGIAKLKPDARTILEFERQLAKVAKP